MQVIIIYIYINRCIKQYLQIFQKEIKMCFSVYVTVQVDKSVIVIKCSDIVYNV